MSLSWGHRPIDDRPGRRRRAIAQLAIVVVLASILSPSGRPLPDAPRTVVAADTPSQLGGLLEIHRRALEERNLTIYRSTVDPTRGREPLRRCMDDLYAIGERRLAQLGALTVTEVAPFGTRYARAYVREREGYARYFFHYAGYTYIYTLPPWQLTRDVYRWYLTEPLPHEFGEMRTKNVDGIEISYWEVDEAVAELVAREALAAREFALAHAPGPVGDVYSVRLHPTRSSGPCLASGQLLSDPDIVHVYTVWLEEGLRALAPATRTMLRHEALHWIQQQTLPGLLRAAEWWLKEGWPEHLVRADRSKTFRASFCDVNRRMSEARLRVGPPAYVTEFTDPGAYYAYAGPMVEYLIERHGEGSYWSLLKETAAPGRDRAEAYRAVLGLTPDDFYREWVSWAEPRYCSEPPDIPAASARRPSASSAAR